MIRGLEALVRQGQTVRIAYLTVEWDGDCDEPFRVVNEARGIVLGFPDMKAAVAFCIATQLELKLVEITQ